MRSPGPSREGQGDHLGQVFQVDARLRHRLADQAIALGQRPGPGGLLALRSQGRALENWLSTTASNAARCSAVRTIWPAPALAKWWDTSRAPAGEKTCSVAVPRRWRKLSSVPVIPGATE